MQFSFVLFPLCCHVSSSPSALRVINIVLFFLFYFYFYLYSNGTEAQRVPSTLIDDETSALHQSSVPPPSPYLLLSGHSVSLALSTSTCVCVDIQNFNSTYLGLEQTLSFHITSPFRCR